MKVRNIAASMVAGVATLASASALAFDFDGVYILGGVGIAGFNDGEFTNEENDSSELEARSDFAWRGGLGAWVTDNIAFEINYFGVPEETSYTENHSQELTTSGSFWDITGLGRCYIADDFWVFGRAGVALSHIEREVETERTEHTVDLHEENGLGASLGVGMQYDFHEVVGIRVEASTIQALNDNDMYAVTGNVVVNFGELM